MRRTALLLLALSATALACASILLLRPTADPWEPPVAVATRVAAPTQAPCAHHDPLRQAFFGDLHVHTGYSMDARSRGMRSTPDDAYRFARGEALGLGPFDENGRGTRRSRLARPLDFAAVTDHAEWIGEVTLCTTPGSSAWESDSCRRYRGELPTKALLPGIGKNSPMTSLIGVTGRRDDICGDDAAACREALAGAWQTTRRATERWNDTSEACAFTTFHGWEHSYSVNMSKVHRNVIFRNASVPEIPISSLEAPDAIDLWDRLDALCTNAGVGCEVLTIPHNMNVSNGRLFEIAWQREDRAEQVRQAGVRARMDRLVEMMQIKGESECRNGLFEVAGGEDELCGFEKIRVMSGAAIGDCEEGAGWGALRGEGCQSRVDFARYALVAGLREAERIGVNPFRFGLIGSTDNHNAAPGAVEERDWPGCCADQDANAEVRLSAEPAFAGAGNVARNPGGLMGVWAVENTRDAIFDAMVRRETFATSGPRMTPRFFGGWSFDASVCDGADLAGRGYAQGVPMGAALDSPDRSGAAPTFVAQVDRDPGVPGAPGGRLDRLQIVKVWHGEDGRFHQAVHDVAGRVADHPNVSVATPGLDLDSCETDGTGYDTLCGVWSDPDFDPTRAAAYYVRAVEAPSCRWSWRACLEIPEADRPAGCSDPNVPRAIQERAWTSPIWFEPST